MLGWAPLFFTAAVLSALFGFSGRGDVLYGSIWRLGIVALVLTLLFAVANGPRTQWRRDGAAEVADTRLDPASLP